MNCYILFLQFISVSEYVVRSLVPGNILKLLCNFFTIAIERKSVCGLQGRWKEGDREMWLQNLTGFLLLPPLVTPHLSETRHKTIREH